MKILHLDTTHPFLEEELKNVFHYIKDIFQKEILNILIGLLIHW